MHAADARVVPNATPQRAGSWRRKAVIPLLVPVLAAVGVTWIQVVETMRDPDPLSIPERPAIAGVVWANRVFIHERSLKRWFEARDVSYAAWARNHRGAVALLRGKPLPPREPRAGTAESRRAPIDVRLALVALVVSGVVGAAALSVAVATGPSRWVLVSVLAATGVTLVISQVLPL